MWTRAWAVMPTCVMRNYLYFSLLAHRQPPAVGVLENANLKRVVIAKVYSCSESIPIRRCKPVTSNLRDVGEHCTCRPIFLEFNGEKVGPVRSGNVEDRCQVASGRLLA